MTAEEMFKELNYFKLKEDESVLIVYQNFEKCQEINFSVQLQEVLKIGTDIYGGTESISFEELKAINKQVEELRTVINDYIKKLEFII